MEANDLRAKSFSVENYLEQTCKTREKSYKHKRRFGKMKAIGIPFALSMMDFAVIYQVSEVAMEQNQIMQWLLAIGMSLLLNFIPYYAANSFIEWKYRLRNHAKLCTILAIGAFICIYTAISYQRYAFRDMFAVEEKVLTNKVASGEAENSEVINKNNKQAEEKANGTLILFIVEPLVTSILSFIISYMTNNKLEEKLEETEWLAKDLKRLESELSCAIKELESIDYEGIKADEELKFTDMKKFIHNYCERLKVNARMSLARYLKEADAVSKLCVTNETGREQNESEVAL